MQHRIKNNYLIMLLGFFVGLSCIMTVLLIIEYRFFKQQAQKMIVLKDEYRTYLIAVKKIVDEYNTSKDQDDTSDQESEEKKKEAESDFLIVNREPGYLKDSMIDFIKKDSNQQLLSQINFEEWRDYTEQLLDSSRSKKRTSYRAGRTNSKRSRINAPKPMRKRIGKQDITFAWPIDKSKFWLSSLFGPRKKPNGKWGFHHGLDMAALKGTLVKAAYDGEIIEAHNGKGFGKTILIRHNAKYKTRYAHLSRILVDVGQKVQQGQVIGHVGDTGIVRSKSGRDPSHLHFEVYMLGKSVNPMYFLV